MPSSEKQNVHTGVDYIFMVFFKIKNKWKVSNLTEPHKKKEIQKILCSPATLTPFHSLLMSICTSFSLSSITDFILFQTSLYISSISNHLKENKTNNNNKNPENFNILSFCKLIIFNRPFANPQKQTIKPGTGCTPVTSDALAQEFELNNRLDYKTSIVSLRLAQGNK